MSPSYQLAKNPFGSIPSYGNPESPADNNPDLADGIGFSKEQQIEEVSRHTVSMSFDLLNLTTNT